MVCKSLIYFFIFLILIGVVSAAVPFQTSDPTQLTIIYPKIDKFLPGSNVDLHFHAMNSSGYQLLNSEYSCMLHLYDYNNHHILTTELLADSNNIDRYADISNHINETGDYSYLVWCNSSNEAGYDSISFKVSNDIEYNLDTVVALGIIALFMLIIGILPFLLRDISHIVLSIFMIGGSMFVIFRFIPGVLMRELTINIFTMTNWIWLFCIWYIPLYIIFWWLPTHYIRRGDCE